MKLVFVDTETTGLDRQSDEIIELAAIRIDWPLWTTEGVFYQRFRPMCPISEGAAAVNGYTPEAWEGAPYLELCDAIDRFVAFTDGARWVGSMPQFDYDFINRARSSATRPFALASRRLIDVGSLGTPLLFAGYGEKGGLDDLCEMMQIADPRHTLTDESDPLVRLTGGRIGPHTAMGDAARTAKVFRRLMLAFTGPDVIESVLRGAP